MNDNPIIVVNMPARVIAIKKLGNKFVNFIHRFILPRFLTVSKRNILAYAQIIEDKMVVTIIRQSSRNEDDFHKIVLGQETLEKMYVKYLKQNNALH
jgi:hypothetical protein